ncbi:MULTISPECIES: hypothetical protein [unclassified Bradyrhizobium]
MQPQQLSFDDYAAAQAVRARDVGMLEAEFAETLTGSDFAEVAYAAICHIARRQAEVHIDDLLRHLKVKPSHPNCMGQIWRRAIKDGVLLKTNSIRPCLSDPLKHLHNYPVYASGVFRGRST